MYLCSLFHVVYPPLLINEGQILITHAFVSVDHRSEFVRMSACNNPFVTGIYEYTDLCGYCLDPLWLSYRNTYKDTTQDSIDTEGLISLNSIVFDNALRKTIEIWNQTNLARYDTRLLYSMLVESFVMLLVCQLEMWYIIWNCDFIVFRRMCVLDMKVRIKLNSFDSIDMFPKLSKNHLHLCLNFDSQFQSHNCHV